MRIDSILVVDNASVFFPKRVGRKVLNVRAVDQVSFSISSAETFGLVGESGSGKSTAGNAAIGLQTLTAGNVFYRGLPIPARRDPKWREMRRQLQIVFQDPYSSLNPRRIIAQALTEPLALHKLVKPSEYTDEVERLLKLVGLPPEVAKCHPNELSGGQRQRVGIARALAVKPEIIVCDEITSALDVSTQAQIISLLSNLKKNTHIALLFISHDLGLVRTIADKIGVMYLGKIVETGPTSEVFSKPYHPYTRALISAAPVPDPDRETQRHHSPLRGEIPDPANPPSGCYFSTRCQHVTSLCKQKVPAMTNISPSHSVACHHQDVIRKEALF